MDRFAFAVEQPIGAERHFADFAVFQKRHLARVIQQRRNIGGDKRFAFAPTDDDRRRIFRDDQALGIAPIEKQQGVGAVDFAQRAAHRLEKIHAALDFFGDQMGDDLAIGLRAEMGAALGQLFFKFEIVFDDAVMHHDDVAGAMRMGIGFRRSAMSRPARVADADDAGSSAGGASRFRQIAELALTAPNRHLAIVEHRDAGRVVAAVFELAQAFQDQRRRFSDGRCIRRCRTLFFVSFHLPALLLGPAFAHAFLAVVEYQRSRGNVMAHRARGSDVNVVAQGDRRHQSGIAADLHAVADRRLIFLEAVVVARDRAGANVGVAADGHVAEIREMVGLGAIANLGFFRLDEIADVNVAA